MGKGRGVREILRRGALVGRRKAKSFFGVLMPPKRHSTYSLLPMTPSLSFGAGKQRDTRVFGRARSPHQVEVGLHGVRYLIGFCEKSTTNNNLWEKKARYEGVRAQTGPEYCRRGFFGIVRNSVTVFFYPYETPKQTAVPKRRIHHFQTAHLFLKVVLQQKLLFVRYSAAACA